MSDICLIDDDDLRSQVKQHPRAQELLRALLYPYGAPDHDFVLRNRTVLPFDAGSPDDIAQVLAGRVPVLAAGSNRSPRQLARKYCAPFDAGDIPVTRGWMHNHDIVYCAHLTGYGAVPATVTPCAGTTVRVAINWLDPDQLHHMHATESLGRHYDYVQIPAAGVVLDCGLTVARVGAYIARYGSEFSPGDTFALADIAAENRRFAARSQWQMLQYVARRAGHVPHPDFIIRLIEDENFRLAQNGLRKP
ncbi:hypothetical protein [Thalassospira mesophila]|uniref:hypothetical protein n=1 Tax=Thalassospira mesophila TaxID=1293891 RepID=UPI00117F2E2C|nr:hypothetical protein [Thalassospira mesophila]